jgi:beta-glucosidase
VLPLSGQNAAPEHHGPVPDSPAIEHQIDGMIAKMTLEQKLDLIGGEDNMFIQAEPSIGFPRLKMSDGPEGVRTWGPDTAYAGGIALAASWDPALARDMGVSIGDDARARGVNFLLGPGVNIYRAAMGGRNFEYFGEDPFLSGQIAAHYILGVQSQGVIATVKHFDANNEEFNRHNLSADMDERTLREIYLPAFEAAVKEGHAGAVMDSYNLVNGVHSTENKHLNIDILRNDWHFHGIVMSDWAATYSAVGAANGGLDLEMPSGYFMNSKNLTPAIQSGQVSVATIDQKVRRIFRQAICFGFLANNNEDQLDLSIPKYSQLGRKVALQEALESITLLKNKGGLLPLDTTAIHTIAILGPDAWPAEPGAGGSSHVDAYAPVSFLTGIADAFAGQVKVLYARGLPTEEEMFQQTEFYNASGKPDPNRWTGDEVRVESFDNPNFQGTPRVFHESHIVGYPGRTQPSSVQHSFRYTAQYKPSTSGDYVFLVRAEGEDAWKLTVDDKTVLMEPSRENQGPLYAEVPLTAGKLASVRLDYWTRSALPHIGLGIRAASDLVTPEARRIAAMADAAVVAAGYDPSEESESFDRTYVLPFGQDQLIEAVAGANPRTIVTITAGGDVDMHRWLSEVPVLLHNWYPGQEGGRALAQILTGKHDPEGHLPISLARSWEQNPVHDSYYPAPPSPDVMVKAPYSEGVFLGCPYYHPCRNPNVFYREGVFLGYRYYTTNNVQPLFPFGFGLSYTTFSFSHLSVVPTADNSAENPEYSVSFDVTNTGSRDGADVAQLYVGDPSAKVKRPAKELKGFEKVRLAAGETKHVTLALDRRSFAYWSDAKHTWQVDPGRFVVYVGDSSEQTPLTQDLRVP